MVQPTRLMKSVTSTDRLIDDCIYHVICLIGDSYGIQNLRFFQKIPHAFVSHINFLRQHTPFKSSYGVRLDGSQAPTLSLEYNHVKNKYVS